jgi:hypothetical protein
MAARVNQYVRADLDWTDRGPADGRKRRSCSPPDNSINLLILRDIIGWRGF